MQIGMFMANGLEEVECLTVVDLLRRAGIEVTTFSIHDDRQITGAHHISILADQLLKEADLAAFDGIVLPGGMPGTLYLKENETVCRVTKDFADKAKLIAAICAAPTVFGALGLLQGKKATCYPGMENDLVGAHFKEDGVVVDGNIITSRGLGTAIDFSLAIITYLLGENTARELSNQIVYNK